MTTIYLMRHSQTNKFVNINNTDSLQVQNEKWPLSIEGEKLAKEKSNNKELQDFNCVISSKYVRAICTAKYFTDNEIFVDEDFGERKFGINDWNELPKDFEEHQFNDFNYKIAGGESLNEVIDREYKALLKILEEYKNKKVLIVGHATSFASLFTKWCEVNIKGEYHFNNKTFFDGKWNFCETFKLVFDNNKNLISIENIK